MANDLQIRFQDNPPTAELLNAARAIVETVGPRVADALNTRYSDAGVRDFMTSEGVAYIQARDFICLSIAQATNPAREARA